MLPGVIKSVDNGQRRRERRLNTNERWASIVGARRGWRESARVPERRLYYLSGGM
jgi:hypothetical protein